MSSSIPDTTSNSLAILTDSGQGRGAQAEQGGRAGRGGRGGRDNQNGGRGRKVFNNSSRRPKFRGSFQVMGGHVFELPEESND